MENNTLDKSKWNHSREFNESGCETDVQKIVCCHLIINIKEFMALHTNHSLQYLYYYFFDDFEALCSTKS